MIKTKNFTSPDLELMINKNHFFLFTIFHLEGPHYQVYFIDFEVFDSRNRNIAISRYCTDLYFSCLYTKWVS